MISKRTKQLKTLHIIFAILHILCLIGPFLYFIPYAYITGEVVSKVALSLTLIVSLILAAISLLVDVKQRAGFNKSIVWILIAGILFCLDSVKSFVWIMAIISIIDELVFTKLKDKFKTDAATNREIDRRL